MFRRSTALPRRSTTDMPDGLDVVCGSASSPSGRGWTVPRRVDARQLPCEGSPFRRRRKRGAWTQAVGVSRGGRTTKIHCLADPCGRIVAIALTPGNIADISMARPMLEAMAPKCRLIADKAYDADRLRLWLRERGIEAVIPGRASRDVASRTGDVSQHAMTASPSTISLPLPLLLLQLKGAIESST